LKEPFFLDFVFVLSVRIDGKNSKKRKGGKKIFFAQQKKIDKEINK
jgi:hypothetical protein